LGVPKYIVSTVSFSRLITARKTIRSPIAFSEIDAHINDQAFADKAFEIFDMWVADGTIQSSA
jgi:uncharacterized protein (UPF0261 family)